MKKNRFSITKIAAFLLAMAPVLIESANSRFWVGEPEIPKHYKK